MQVTVAGIRKIWPVIPANAPDSMVVTEAGRMKVGTGVGSGLCLRAER